MLKKILVNIILALLLVSCLVMPALATSPINYDSIGGGYNNKGDYSAIFNDLIAVEKDSKWGFADINGNIKIPCQYSEVKIFRDGYAPIRINSKWGVINTAGKLIIEAQYDTATRVFMEYKGNELKKKYPGYDLYAQLSSKYIAVGKTGSDKLTVSWGIIDNAGKVIISPQYPVSIYGYSQPPVLINESGLFALMQNFKKNTDAPDDIRGGIVDKTGKIILPFEYECKSTPPGICEFTPYFSDGLALVQNVKTGKHSYIDKTGRIVLTLSRNQPGSFNTEPVEHQLFNFREGMCRIVAGDIINGKWGFIDRTGKTVVAPQYEKVSDYISNYAAVKKNNKIGFIDKKGKIVIPIVYDYNPKYFINNVASLTNGMVAVGKAGKYGVVDSSGKTVLPFFYDSLPSYNPADGLFIVKKGNKYGFVNKNNKVVIPIKYQAVSHFVNNIAKVELGYQYGYINKSGKVVIPIKYNSLSHVVRNRIYAVDKAGTQYLLDLVGRILMKAGTGKVIN